MKIISLLRVWFNVYRLVLSPFLRVGFQLECRYEESCSYFMERSIRETGWLRGICRGLKRFASCNQWS